MVALGLLDVEADLVDAFGQVEVQELIGHRQAVARQHGDHVERHAVGPEASDTGQRLVERALAAARLAVPVMQRARPVDAHAHADIPFLK